MRKKAASVLCSLATLCAANVSSSSVESRAVASPSIWPSQTFVTEDFTAPNMTIIRSGDTVPGYLFLTPAGNGTTSQAPILISDSNELIWSGPAGGWVYNGFRVQDVHNEPHLSYWKGNSSATFGHGYGSVHVLNSSYHEVYNICPSATELDLVTPGHVSYACYLDMHEASITNQGTLLATAYNVTQADLTSVGGPKNGWIFDSLFFEIDLATGKVLFRWRSLDHLPKIPLNQSQYPLVLATGTFGTTQILPWDYFHINSVQALPDGYLVNSRHLFSTYKISKNGSIDWHLSGSQDIPSDFTLPPSAYFSWQHDPRIYNATKTSLTITYFNNDNSEAPGQNGTNSSTGLNLSLDLASHSVTLLRKFTVPHAPIFADSQGSYQPLPNGHALLGYGQVAKTREFNASGNLVYEAQYGYSTAISQVASYRSYRQTWSAQPATAPKLVAKCSDGTTGMTSSTTKVYLSWNGATTYDSWNIFAGNSTTDLSAVASIPKTGFETEYVLEGQWKYVLAEAKDGHRPLRNASIVSTNCSW